MARIRLGDLEISETQDNVLAYLADKPATNDELASALTLSPKTIKNVLEDIYERFGVKGKPHARELVARMYLKLKGEELARQSLREQLDLQALRLIEVGIHPGPTAHEIMEIQRQSLADGTIRPGTAVVGRFGSSCSRTWKDPFLLVAGLWNPDLGKVVDLPDNLSVAIGTRRRRDSLDRQLIGFDAEESVPLAPGWKPLCIPSYAVPVEFREQSYVVDPLWQAVKERVVRQFLNERPGKEFVCITAWVYLHRHGFVVTCNEYDKYLYEKWF